MTLQLRYAAKSDVGLVRQGNEDSGYAGPRLLMVADGMGGHAAGELASATAVAIVSNRSATVTTISGRILSNTDANSNIPIPVVLAAAVKFSPSRTLKTLAAIVKPSMSI